MNKHFPKIKLAIMIISFVIFTFGVYFLGRKYTQIQIPVFICPINPEGTIEGGCYYLSHLNNLFSWGPIQKVGLFFLSTFALIIIFGRTLCGFFCPFGFVQDLIYKIRASFEEGSMRFGEKYLPVVKLVKWGFLGVFFGSWMVGINFCEICPVIAFIPPAAGIKVIVKMSFFIAIIVVVGSFFKARFWCNVCPLGHFIGLFNKVSLFRLTKDCQACTECGACYEVCPTEIKIIYTEREKKNVTTSSCLFCTECVKVCPEDKALSVTFLGKRIYTSSREGFFHNNK